MCVCVCEQLLGSTALFFFLRVFAPSRFHLSLADIFCNQPVIGTKMSGWADRAEHLKLRFSRVFSDRAVPWWTMAREGKSKTSTELQLWWRMDGWWGKTRVIRRTGAESAEGGEIWGGKRERTLPAAAVGGPNGEMREGWETARQSGRERDKKGQRVGERHRMGHRERSFFFFQRGEHPYERQREREKKREHKACFLIKSTLPPVDYCVQG